MELDLPSFSRYTDNFSHSFHRHTYFVSVNIKAVKVCHISHTLREAENGEQVVEGKVEVFLRATVSMTSH